ncbi:hypothetical protein DDZ15_13795 [Rhodohalobacter mucosus]|uniref:Uncharacterized protein n=1 Tax=Rhodohalobacter mucosus TaxID=2079485 RepID=A0A316TQX6_9BACT|nr:hypothetical protein DDZ15_13795 [Rhodohalobacter mucosus]
MEMSPFTLRPGPLGTDRAVDMTSAGCYKRAALMVFGKNFTLPAPPMREKPEETNEHRNR